MLFSATVPKWVKKLVKQHLNSECGSLACGHFSQPASQPASSAARATVLLGSAHIHAYATPQWAT